MQYTKFILTKLCEFECAIVNENEEKNETR